MATTAARKTTAKKTTEKAFDLPLAKDGGKAFEKLLTDERFVGAIYPDDDETVDPIGQMAQLRKLMKALFGKDGYAKLAEHFDHDMLKMQEFMVGKASDAGASALNE